MPRRKKDKPKAPKELPQDSEQDQGEESIDPDVKDIFEEAQGLDFGRGDLVRKLDSYTGRSPELTGGDIDASWEYADVGEEAVGGSNPTPDQSVVDEEGKALGVTYEDNEPLHTTDKLEKRDEDPWELNPASSPDFSKRVDEEFNAPVNKLAAEAGVDINPDQSVPSGPAPKGQRRETQSGKNQPNATKRNEKGNRATSDSSRQAPSARGNAAGAAMAKGVGHTDISRSTRNNRQTNVARGARRAPGRVRHTTARGKSKRA